MYKYQIKRLLVKCAVPIFVCLLIMAATKIYTVYKWHKSEYGNYLTSSRSEYFDEMLEESKDLDFDGKSEYLQELMLSEKMSDEDYVAAVGKYSNNLRSVQTTNGIINYCSTGSGLVSAEIPEDLAKNIDSYDDLQKADMVNDEPFLKFLDLQSNSLSVIAILIITAVFAGETYEKNIHLTVNISPKNKSFYLSQKIIVLGFIFVLYTLNFIFDLLISGYVFQSNYSDTYLQSIPTFKFSTLNLTISCVVIFLYVLQLLFSLISLELFMLLASKLCSVKNLVSTGIFLVVVMSLIAKYVPWLLPYLFAAFGNRTQLVLQIQNTGHIITAVLLSVVILFCVSIHGSNTFSAYRRRFQRPFRSLHI